MKNKIFLMSIFTVLLFVSVTFFADNTANTADAQIGGLKVFSDEPLTSGTVTTYDSADGTIDLETGFLSKKDWDTMDVAIWTDDVDSVAMLFTFDRAIAGGGFLRADSIRYWYVASSTLTYATGGATFTYPVGENPKVFKFPKAFFAGARNVRLRNTIGKFDSTDPTPIYSVYIYTR